MSAFPGNIITVIKSAVDTKMELPDGLTCLGRPLRTTDGNGATGIFPVNRRADQDSIFIGGGPPIPTLRRYEFRIHQLVKHTNEEDGREQYSQVAEDLWNMLYHDRDLHVALQQLVETSGTRKQRFQKAGIAQQNFLNNEINKQFIFLVSTEYWVETQTDDTGGW